MGIEAILALVGLVVPPAFDFIKKKFLKPTADTPEATMATLATTKPEVMKDYLLGQAGLLDAKVKYFNRDIAGMPSQWVIDMRASIRPVGVIIAIMILAIMGFMALAGDYKPSTEVSSTMAAVRAFCILIVTSWFGDRISDSE
jgi:hypothetical protein